MAADNTSYIGKSLLAESEVTNESSIDMLLLNLAQAEKARMASMERLKKAEQLYDDQIFKRKVENIKKSGMTQEAINAEIAKMNEQRLLDIVKLAQQMEDTVYRYSSTSTKKRMLEEKAATIEQTKFSIQQKMQEVLMSTKHGNAKNAELRKLRQQQIALGQTELETEKRKRALGIAFIQQKRKDRIASRDDIEAELDAINESYEQERKLHSQNIDYLNEQIRLLEEKKEAGEYKDGGKLDEELEELKKQLEEEKSSASQSKKDHMKDGTLANVMKGVEHALNEGMSALGSKIEGAINGVVETVGQYRSGIEARLQGSQASYDSVAKTLKSSLAVSPFVKQKEVLEKLNEAVNQGIAYNVEQRAFLATMSDKIVSTFNAFDSNLLRIIRLQQADTTAARMGMEAQLLQFFNSTYSDSNYLTDGYDTVSQALIDANAQMTRDMSISFEYNVQKWLGSLASLGFGTDTISTIATGINYLGSGNVQALAGNTQLQNLMAMSASRAGLSYSDMLVQGIDDSQVNTLLKAMVEYLREIATDNNAVVKAAYGDIFNFSQADLRAASNLTDGDIGNIYSQSMTYSTAMSEINSQLSQIGDRLSMNEMIDNVFDNFLYTSGETIANNAGMAITWRLLNTIEEFTGGIHLPAISIFGNMVDLSTFTIEGIAKTGLFGLGALANAGKMITSISSGGGMDLSIWGGEEFTTRGGNYTPTTKGVQSSTSGSKAKASASSSDTKKESIASTEEDQEESKKSSKESMGDQKTIDDLYKAVVVADQYINIIDPTGLLVLNEIKNATTSTAATTKDTYKKVDDIYTLLSNTLTVKVSGLDSLTTLLSEKKVQPVKLVDNTNIGNYIDITDKFSSLEKTIRKSLTGQEDSTKSSEQTNTLPELIKHLMGGSLEIIDKNTREGGDMYKLVNDKYTNPNI